LGIFGECHGPIASKLAPTGFVNTANLCGSGLARDEALKNTTTFKAALFLNKNETGFRGRKQ
jgi:hypothetical protein